MTPERWKRVETVFQGALERRLDSGPLPAPRAVEYAIQTARGLAAAHERFQSARDLAFALEAFTPSAVTEPSAAAGSAHRRRLGAAVAALAARGGAGEGLREPSAACLCGSDLPGFLGLSGRRQPGLVMGHETVARVVETHPGVEGWRHGQRVCLNPLVSCSTCPACLAGRQNLCAE